MIHLGKDIGNETVYNHIRIMLYYGGATYENWIYGSYKVVIDFSPIVKVK